ncbi:hypothetical protein NtRootA2_41440 (plasmid) [Arthrobacter sp. NtRootA2]|nr:hypothetical protein NtRootA2_41110 [Arthrobacter sp. NtRootA2]BCW12862.1 hypothetical protein NtRootA2_41440 [Arthrobacter sp. NtRootA2]
MAHIDNLVASIPDERLRLALEAEVRKLSGNRSFGLVYDEHKPESVLLYRQTRVRRLDKVQVMADGSEDRTCVDDSGIWIVQEVTGETAFLAHKADASLTRTVPRERCVIVREFDDPIYPGLRSLGKIESGGDKPFHAVINSENYHALQTLLYPYANKVDVIYIDPPYNSGARDWTYNNDFVDRKDDYRHSKWLSFMEKRLALGRKLLKSDGVMVVTIDEHEVHRLGVLLGQMFQDADITMVSIVINPKGVTRPGFRRFSRVDEYAFFCFFGSASVDSWGDDLLTLGAADLEREAAAVGQQKRPRWKGLLRSGTNARRVDRKDLFYPVLIDPKRRAVVGVGPILPLDEQPDFDTLIDGLAPVWPVRRDGSLGNWGVGPTTLTRMIEKGYVSLGGHDAARRTWALSYLSKEPQEQIAAGILEVLSYDQERNVVDVVYADPGSAGRRIKTIWHRTTHDAGVGGTDVVSALLGGREFTFPKSVYAVRDVMEMLTKSNPDALILDFFGGSGTTTHAVSMLNAEDGGRRRSILITNNELEADDQEQLRGEGIYPGHPGWDARGVFQRATRPRIEAAISGISQLGKPLPESQRNADGTPMSAGLSENVEFFELTYEDPGLVSLGRRFTAVAPLLWLMAGAKGDRITEVSASGWAVPSNATYGVLFDPAEWSDFVAAVVARDATEEPLTHAFVVTDSATEYRQVISKLPRYLVTEQLYEDYLRNFEINREG